MKTHHRSSVLSLFLVISICGRFSAEEFSRPTAQVLLLRNGHALSGTVTPAGDRYLVTTGGGGQMVVPRADVDMVCDSLQDAYVRKRDGITRRDANSHLALAEWCFRQRMLPQAADQILAAYVADPNDRRIASLEKRLAIEASRGNTEAANRSEPNPTPAGPTTQDIDDTIRRLPESAIEKYVTTIQPFVLTRCAGNSCHNVTAKNEFRLIRGRPGEPLTTRYTRRNLYSLLQFVDTRAPQESRLLQIVSSPHGNAGPLMPPGDRYHEQMVAWIGSLGGKGAELSHNDSKPLRMDYSVRQATNQETVRPGSSGSNRETRSTSDERPMKSGGEPSDEPDPLDPELFNNRYLKKSDGGN